MDFLFEKYISFYKNIDTKIYSSLILSNDIINKLLLYIENNKKFDYVSIPFNINYYNIYKNQNQSILYYLFILKTLPKYIKLYILEYLIEFKFELTPPSFPSPILPINNNEQLIWNRSKEIIDIPDYIHNQIEGYYLYMNCKTPFHIIITIILLDITNEISKLQCIETKNNPKGTKRSIYYKLTTHFEKLLLSINKNIL